jgi:zinc finger protein
MASQNLFPSIGTLAEQADGSADTSAVNGSTGAILREDDSEDRVVQEVESLCMNCEEQVGTHLFSW